MTLKRNNPTNIRFDEPTKKRLICVASRLGLTSSDLVRAAVDAQLPEWEKNGVTLKRRTA